ncbi:BREX-1 system adenine-specific DNA-methyltransferase PglX [Pseudomonas sp. 18.1.10]|uniref:BREX-1 system adenine-specific DNA-methyltransferase PglX n=1 Tax=Pseudomonas sp. 18.1.10 TaxID=2969302 RepID=UPI00214FE64E|nr:BREX-1 system adenine-specific DNA-methyltransferase PglX [Pseudomonas sp. 18.1.10]MCR4537203.1 BREX-1 system adenine-specific DNA-methyltransferase PglX [Pseudomonas sp. 18.1.10]
MNRSALKKYAPQARLDFIEAVTLRTRRLGLDPAMSVSVEQTGDVLLIGGQPFPASVAKQRSELARRIQQQGFNAVIEALAYTWFNRLVAIRFMELKGYLSHGYRVLSHPQGHQPEILDHVQHLDLPGLDKAEVIRLKTAGNQDEVLYREILLAQCHELHRNMPFLFEALDDATELLLPDNLLRTDSPIARLVSDIEEANWQEVEIIGWLYQFYISEKKDEVIGKVVKSEDIPAATQLFTPNWIVQYLVQNSLGRLWLMANSGSNLKEKMPYYVDPAEQTPEVLTRLDALITVRMDEDGGTLNPESLSILDPACGSGHILVEAYNLLRAIYEERGYRLRDIPRLILQKNLFGLDIDDRAAQLAGFALLMKAREDDHRLFDDEGNPPRLNVLAVQQSADWPDEEIAQTIINAAIQIEGGEEFHSGQLFGGGQLATQHSSGLTVLDVRQLIQLFENGKTFGSLIRVPDALKNKLGSMIDLLTSVLDRGDDLSRSYAKQVLEQFALPANILKLQYDVVVANPPYMGANGMNQALKGFAKKYFAASKADLFAMFIERGFFWSKSSGFNSMVTMQSWMFIATYEGMRRNILAERALSSLVQIGYNSFPEMNSKVAQACAFSFFGSYPAGFSGVYVDLNSASQAADKSELFLGRTENNVYTVPQEGFKSLPGSPLAYGVSETVRNIFSSYDRVSEYYPVKSGIMTGNDPLYLRLWFEVSHAKIGFGLNGSEEMSNYWYPMSKGGEFRRWYGNSEHVINLREGGLDIKDGGGNYRLRDERFYFKRYVTWSRITSSKVAFRVLDGGVLFADAAPGVFAGENCNALAGFLNSKLVDYFLKGINPTLNIQTSDVEVLPYKSVGDVCVVDDICSAYKDDWDSFEGSWDFTSLPFINCAFQSRRLSHVWEERELLAKQIFSSVKALEEKNNRIYIDAYGLQSELSAEIAEEEIMLAPAERDKDMKRLVSYAVGCMMGRYSLDEQGLIYANSGGIDFDPSRYTKFRADSDGIIPITDESWFEDDAAECMREFVKVVWGTDAHVENMEWLADSLGRKAGESADDAIRRYLSTSFYKDHLQTYKKRPIYWLFSSGKQKAFECLVYLHRYNEGTLSRMRMEYVVPLQSRMQARIDKLADDINSATGSAQQKALQKRKDKFTKQLEELRRFDETLRPYADQRIALDLDDGVKVNYGKFGDLLADVKSITGGKED